MVTIPALVIWIAWKLFVCFSPKERTKREKQSEVDAFKDVAKEFADGEAERQYELAEKHLELEARQRELEARQRELEARQFELKTEEKRKRESWRDADVQDNPYTYKIDRHALETLAMRYGIAHQGRGSDGRIREKDTIRIKKLSALGSDRYMITLPDYRDRRVVAIIRKGEEFVRTFYPLDEKSWFEKNRDWEAIFKGNPSWTIKDIARMHVERINALASSKSEG